MESETQKFLEAEKVADELVETLTKLKSEVESYDSATKELNEVREDLNKFIELTKDVVVDSHETLKTIKAISGPKIIERLQQIESLLSKEADIHKANNKTLTILISIVIVLAIIPIVLAFIL
ncbi:MAG: hypothetical protein HQ510_05450 [Candidatus Marinimicrobia bacterium]|nr:hypothetical protein [Candidatus Neomarinimicrobiota bacterium]